MKSGEEFISHALALAERGTALASPNPMVGAVLVRDGKIVGEGFHTYEGRKHAEIIAIEQAREGARGATLDINLEPCCHTGRTGPCTDAILAAGIRKVVAAMSDPNPQVSGKGFEILRKAGVEVEVGLMEERARYLNESFARYIRTGLPLVTLKTAMTLDGRIAAPDDNSGWVTSEAARAHVQRQRHAHDAILTGIGTILADDPLLTDRSGLPRRRPLLRVVMDSRLRTPASARLLSEVNGDVLIFTLPSADDPGKRRELERLGVEVCVGEKWVQASRPVQEQPGRPVPRPDLRHVLEELGRRQITSVLLEAGAALNGAALDAALVDKVFLYYAPKVLGGGDSLPMATGRGVRAMRDALSVTGIRRYDFGPDFAVEGYLRDVYAV